ncbi:MAG TPA: hypothetical protein VIV54_23020 [Burkholderiales bacterium]
MQSDSRTATYGRIGRSYPRPAASLPAADHAGERRLARRFGVAGAVIALLATLSVVGWLLAK